VLVPYSGVMASLRGTVDASSTVRLTLQECRWS
jgi:hypothetical protein